VECLALLLPQQQRLLLLLYPTCWVIWFHPQRVTPGTMAEV
jgi:hypothetical protein